jgi:hypothetical protein
VASCTQIPYQVLQVCDEIIAQHQGAVNAAVEKATERLKENDVYEDTALAAKLNRKCFTALSALHKDLVESLQAYDAIMQSFGKNVAEDTWMKEAEKVVDRCVSMSVRWGAGTLITRIENNEELDESIGKLAALWNKHSSETEKERLSLSDAFAARVTAALKHKKTAASAPPKGGGAKVVIDRLRTLTNPGLRRLQRFETALFY